MFEWVSEYTSVTTTLKNIKELSIAQRLGKGNGRILIEMK